MIHDILNNLLTISEEKYVEFAIAALMFIGICKIAKKIVAAAVIAIGALIVMHFIEVIPNGMM